MAEETRERLLAAAQTLFAERGFHGTSLAHVAGALGLTKQALLYHFKRKEELYGEVLRRISARLLGVVRGAQEAQGPDAVEALTEVILALHRASQRDPQVTRIVLRELLDNHARAASAKDWYLRPLLDEITALLRACPGQSRASFAEAFALTYQLLGAVEYFAASGETLRGMYGEAAMAEVAAAYPKALRRQIQRLAAAG
ncbi:MAG: TetR family transcriptional regulator [Pseudomonadota bacterium]